MASPSASAGLRPLDERSGDPASVALGEADAVDPREIQSGHSRRVQLLGELLENGVLVICRNDVQDRELVLNGSPDRLDHVLRGAVSDDVDHLAVPLEVPLGEGEPAEVDNP